MIESFNVQLGFIRNIPVLPPSQLTFYYIIIQQLDIDSSIYLLYFTCMTWDYTRGVMVF